MIFIIFHFQLHGHPDAPADSKALLCQPPFKPQPQSTPKEYKQGERGHYMMSSCFWWGWDEPWGFKVWGSLPRWAKGPPAKQDHI